MATHPLDALAAAPDHRWVLVENDRVRILDTNIRPGEQTPLRAHEWPAAIYVVSWSDLVRRDQHGEILLDTRGLDAPNPGAGLWVDPLPPHSVENVGGADLHIIAVEVKG